jgi:hypothetical protein
MAPARDGLAVGLASLVLSLSMPLSADEGPVRTAMDQLGIELGIEHFRWQEYDDQGARLLSEHGPRFLFAATLDNHMRPDSGIVLGARLSGYLATVDYDGQDTGRRFVGTESDYHGWDFRAEGGWRFAELVGGAAALDLFAGFGIEQWTRDIKGGVNALGVPVQGLVEDYTVRYVRAGLGLAHNHVPPQGRLALGFRRPLSIDEDVVIGGVPLRLHPGKRASSFASYKVSLFPDAHGRPFGMYLKLYYENYRFGRSGTATVGNLLVWQPRSHLDRFGAMLGYSF